MQLQPGEDFTIVHQLDDPSDAGTYFVQAKVRKSKDDTLLATVNLTDKGAQRFTGNWHVSADTSGLGTYVDVETIVYTDSGYTTISDRYSKQVREHIIQDRFDNGVGGGADVDYNKIGAMMREGRVEAKETDLKPIMDRLTAIEGKIEEIDIPEPKEADIPAVLKAVEEAKRAIESKFDGLPQPEVDIDPFMEAIDFLRDHMKATGETQTKKFSERNAAVQGELMQIGAKLTEIVESIKGLGFTFEMPVLRVKTDIGGEKPVSKRVRKI